MSSIGSSGVVIDLRGKTALVTGCRRGLGRSITIGLATAGADIVGVSRELSETDGVVEEVRQLGRSFDMHRCDLSNRLATKSLLADIDDRGTAVDILVNNAGTIARSPVNSITEEAWDAQIEGNLSSPFLLSRHFGMKMAQRGGGKVVSIASVLSFQGGMNVSAYVAAKSGLAGLTRALSNEWAKHGVNVNAVAPGYFETDMTAPLQEDAERRRSITKRIPAGRWGFPDELTGAVLFLASSSADYVHGIVLPVDGGWLAG